MVYGVKHSVLDPWPNHMWVPRRTPQEGNIAKPGINFICFLCLFLGILIRPTITVVSSVYWLRYCFVSFITEFPQFSEFISLLLPIFPHWPTEVGKHTPSLFTPLNTAEHRWAFQLLLRQKYLKLLYAKFQQKCLENHPVLKSKSGNFVFMNTLLDGPGQVKC